jgi:hypothetical protein
MRMDLVGPSGDETVSVAAASFDAQAVAVAVVDSTVQIVSDGHVAAVVSLVLLAS